MAAYVATRNDLDRLRERLTRLGVKLPSALLPAKSISEQDFTPKLSRRTLRLFLSLYALTNLYENILLGLLRRKPLVRFLKDLLLRSSAGFAGFIALYSLIYRLAQRSLRSILPSIAQQIDGSPSRQPKGRSVTLRVLNSDSLHAFLAGAVASPALLLDRSPTRRTTVALYTLQKAVQASWTSASVTGWVPSALQKTSWWFGPHILFALSNAQLLHAFVFDADCFPESYSRFILRFSDAYVPQRPAALPASSPWPTPRQLVDSIASSAKSKTPYPKFESPLLHPTVTIPSQGPLGLAKPVLDLAHPMHTRLVCATLHPDVPQCSHVARTFAGREFIRATRFFVILSALRMILSWRKTSKDPAVALIRAAKFSIGSGAGVAGCIGAAWASICLLQAYLPNNVLPTRRFYLQGFAAGLFILLSPARSADLSMYSARLALFSAWQVAVKRRYVRNIRHGEVVSFAVASGTVMAIFERGPEAAVTGYVRRLLKAVGGSFEDAS